MPRVFLELENLPFITGIHTDFQDDDLPRSLPFRLGINEKIGLAVQLPEERTRKAIELAYRKGSLASTPLGEGTFGQFRMQTLMKPLFHLLGDAEGKRFLEMGCGTGAPMAELARRGAIVEGCDMGPHAQRAAQVSGCRVIQDRFSSRLFPEPFDCVYSFSFLEHIEDVVEFVRDAVRCLRRGGLFYATLQNSGPFLESGDLSLLAHEHWNYFTWMSAENLLRFVGLVGVSHRELVDCGELAFWGSVPSGASLAHDDCDLEKIESLRRLVERYGKMVTSGIEHMKCFLALLHNQRLTVAFYGGGTQYVPLARAAGQIIRFIDGDEAKHGKYWMPSTRSIEPPFNLIREPVDVVVICAETYSDDITRFLTQEIKISSSTKILRSRDISSGQHWLLNTADTLTLP